MSPPSTTAPAGSRLSLTTESDDDRVVPVRFDLVRSAYNRRRHSDLDVGHPRSRAVIGESYNLPRQTWLCCPSGRPRPAHRTRPAVGGMDYHEAGSPGVSAALGWGRLAFGARCLGAVRQPTVRGGCYRRP
jgi:hypothetical protein